MNESFFWTNRGLYLMVQAFLRNSGAPTTFYLALLTDDTPPTRATDLMSDASQIAVGNGYSGGGTAVARNSTDWDTLTEDDGLNQIRALMKDITFTASGGDIPASGNPIRWIALTDDNATVADRQIIACWKLPGGVTVPSGQDLTIQDYGLYTNNL
jgi:hypothetical protein